MTPNLSCATGFRILLLFAVALSIASCSLSKEKAGIQTVFVQGQEKFDVSISTNELGVILQEPSGERQKAAIGTLEGYGLRFQERVTEAFLIFRVPHARSRSQIVALARALRVSEAKTIAAVGLVMRFAGSESPLVVTDDFIVQYTESASSAEIARTHERIGVTIMMENPYAKNQFVVRLAPDSRTDALEAANALNESPLVQYAHPNFYREVVERQMIPNDTYFGNQWHLHNTGQSGGTVDADIDAPLAWDFTLGNANVLIAVIDGGFDTTHPDLMPNLWTNPGEIAGDGVDNDGNGLIDDVNGWNFDPCGAAPAAGCGDNDLAGGTHGTRVAGAVAARGNNALGVSGSCPHCQIMFIRGWGNSLRDALAFGYAQQMGADIITSSWGYNIGTAASADVIAAINAAATNGRGGLGSVVLFAKNNLMNNDCEPIPDISSLESVIAVGSSTNNDRFWFGGFGDCMDVLGTSTWPLPPLRGTLLGMTTDLQGTAGENTGAGNTCLSGTEPTSPPANALDYTYCFNGNSFATPVTAGVAGLILALDATPTRLQVQRLIQDTADKTENSVANYDPELGFSNEGDPTTPATHGFGRVNAFEAVRIAAPAAAGGRDGVDIFVRDNELDWGNTEQLSNVTFEPTRGFLGHWRSVDIKIDAPPYQTPPTSAATFAAMVDDQPKVGEANRVYVRVRNRGFRPASNVRVKLLWTQFGTALPNFPNSTIWTDFTDVATAVGDWNQLGVRTQPTLGYSGVSVANTINDLAGIFRFDNFEPTFDASKPNHYCLFAVLTSDQDPVTSTTLVPDVATPTDNNVTHRNVQVDPSSLGGGRSSSGLFVRNPFDFPIATILEVTAPKAWRVSLHGPLVIGKPLTLKPQESRLVKINVNAGKGSPSGEVTITQYRIDEKKQRIPLGGVVLDYKSEEDVMIEQPLLWLERYYRNLFVKRGPS